MAQTNRTVLIRHFEYLPNYANKNLGYFAQASQNLGHPVRWQIGPDWFSLFQRWHRVWLYPYEKRLLLKLIILRLFGNKVILKTDSIVFPRWRAQLIKPLVAAVLAETSTVAAPFGTSPKVKFFSGGLPQTHLELIKKIRQKRNKIILYTGRQTPAKGFDRLTKIIPRGWQLQLAENLPPEKYYRLMLSAGLVVLPTRGEGWPNVFADAFYCRRLFLTTTGAKCGQAILDKTFYCHNSIAGLRQAIIKITQNLNTYYRNFPSLYDPSYFQPTDQVFAEILK